MHTEKKIRLPIMNDKAALTQLEPLALPNVPFTPANVSPIDTNRIRLADQSNLRTSSYTIYVDLPGVEDEMLLVHGYTGAYDRVSKRVATYLRSLESKHAPKPLYGDWTSGATVDGVPEKPSDETIAVLKRRGYLVALTPNEEETLFAKLVSQHHISTVRQMPSYVLMPTYQCNLRCHYCFQDHMRTDPSLSHLLRIMDKSMVDRVVSGMQNIEAAHGISSDEPRTRSVLFFGGEPLLAESRPIVEYIMERVLAIGKGSFSAVTNATDLAAYRDLLGPDRIASVQITLDGPPDEHDKRRIYADGSGSFARIADNISMALERGIAVSVRMNIDPRNIQQLPQLAEEFHARGWTGFKTFQPYVAPITPTENVSAKQCFSTWQLGRALDELKKQFPKVAGIIGTDDSIQGQARRIFDSQNAGRPGLHSAFCGAHTGMYVIDAFADIYACWERTGDPQQRIGHIGESGDVFMNKALLHQWRGRNAVSNQVCRKCRYAASCGGGCAVLAEETAGDLYKNYCDGYANRFRASVAKAYLEFQRGERSDVNIMRLCDA